MDRRESAYTLYLVTDRELMSTETLEQAVEQAVRGGCTMVQLREKRLFSREFYETALRVKRVCKESGVPLIINDRVDIALAAGADGVHVGSDDLPAAAVRRLIGPDKILGVSASTLEEAEAAARAGADYLGVGAMYPTKTKKDARIVSREELERICRKVPLPVVVIGGINRRTVKDFAGIPIAGLAVVSDILADSDIAGAAASLKRLFLETRP